MEKATVWLAAFAGYTVMIGQPFWHILAFGACVFVAEVGWLLGGRAYDKYKNKKG